MREIIRARKNIVLLAISVVCCSHLSFAEVDVSMPITLHGRITIPNTNSLQWHGAYRVNSAATNGDWLVGVAFQPFVDLSGSLADVQINGQLTLHINSQPSCAANWITFDPSPSNPGFATMKPIAIVDMGSQVLVRGASPPYASTNRTFWPDAEPISQFNSLSASVGLSANQPFLIGTSDFTFGTPETIGLGFIISNLGDDGYDITLPNIVGDYVLGVNPVIKIQVALSGTYLSFEHPGFDGNRLFVNAASWIRPELMPGEPVDVCLDGCDLHVSGIREAIHATVTATIDSYWNEGETINGQTIEAGEFPSFEGSGTWDIDFVTDPIDVDIQLPKFAITYGVDLPGGGYLGFGPGAWNEDGTVCAGGVVEFDASAAKGYVIRDWYVDGTEAQQGGDKFLYTVTGNHHISVDFRLSNGWRPVLLMPHMPRIFQKAGLVSVSVPPDPTAGQIWVRWGTSIKYENSTSMTTLPSSSTNSEFSFQLTNLIPNTTYYYQFIVTNSSGLSYGTNDSFVTAASRPAVSNTDVKGVTATRAILQGQLDPYGLPTQVWISGGPTATNGKPEIYSYFVGAQNTNVPIRVSLTNLLPSTSYRFSVVASNSMGVSVGAGPIFATMSTPLFIYSNSLPAIRRSLRQ